MLVAEFDGVRVEADLAERRAGHVCPNCKALVTLRRGRIVTAHFAHKPPTSCTWAAGETKAHLMAKKSLADAIASRGLRTAVEHIVPALPGDRRADVAAWSPNGKLVAFELQHTSISIPAIEARAKSYAGAGIAQMWIPLIPMSVWSAGVWHGSRTWFVERYSARPFEKWVHGFHAGAGMWMFDTRSQSLWLATLAAHLIHVEETSWYSEGGEENYGGGYDRTSKRYRELTLRGPYSPKDLLIKYTQRKAFHVSAYSWPAGRVANFVRPKTLSGG